MAYNTLYTFVAFTVPSASNLNNNDTNMDFLKTQVNTHLAQGRLTLETGVPVSTTDQTGKTTVYYAPYNGNRIGLKSGSSWDLYSFSEVSLSLSSYIKGVVYDIFGYLSGGSLALESLAWKKVTASNSPTSGSANTINIADTGDLAIGREVTVKDGSNSEVTTVTALVSNTSITVDLTNSYTTPDVYGFNTRATALTLDDGKWVKSGDATRRYLGTIRITTTTGQCEDSKANRFVWNVDNQVLRELYKTDATVSWSTASATYGYARGQATNRVALVVGLSNEQLSLIAQETVFSSSSSYYHYLAVGEDSATASAGLASLSAGSGGVFFTLIATLNKTPGIGYHFYPWLEKYTTGAFTVQGSGCSGLYGFVKM